MMARWGKCDFRELKALRDRLDKLAKQDYDAFCQAAAKELAARLLAKVIKRTPVGEYEKSTGKKGGTLRRGWTARTEEAAQSGGTVNAQEYAQSLPVTKQGDVYQIEIINPVHYASYVEYGHRTRSHKGWVKGRFMLTVSEQELEAEATALLEKKLARFLRECTDGK